MDNDTIPTRYEALCAALEILHTQTAIGAECGLSQTAVWKWFQTRVVPVEHVPNLSKATGIPDYYFRPDFFRVPVRAKHEALCDIVARNKRPQPTRRKPRTRAPRAPRAVASQAVAG